MAFLLQPTARAGLIKIPLNVQFELITGMIRLTAGALGLCLAKI